MQHQRVRGCPSGFRALIPRAGTILGAADKLPLLSTQHLGSVADTGPINTSLIISLMREKARRARAFQRRIRGFDGWQVNPGSAAEMADEWKRNVF